MAMQPSQHSSSMMEKGMLEELLLVCTFVGTTGAPSESGSSFVKGEDFLAWLHDLQRVLRRDETDEQSVRVTLGSWKVLETKLLPIAEASAGDEEATRTLVKIFILLTRPMSNRALEALAASSSRHESLASLRTSALAQVRILAEARAAFAARPRVLRLLLAFLQSALTGSGREERSKQAQIDLELTVTLVRNLVIPLPTNSVSTEIETKATQAWDELVATMHDELFLEVLSELASALNLKQNLPLNLILLEIFAALFSAHAPADLARAELEVALNKKAPPLKATNTRTPNKRLPTKKLLPNSNTGALTEALARDRAHRKLRSTGARHARFGSLIEVKKGDQHLALTQLSSSALKGVAPEASQGLTGTNAIQKRGYAFVTDSELDRKTTTRKTKKVDDCRGDGEDPLFAADDEEDETAELDRGPGPRPDEVWRVPQSSRLGISARRARTALSKLATQLSRHGFGTLLEATKQEHRLESARIQARDKHSLLAFAEFCLIWRRERAHFLCAELTKLAETARNDRVARKRVAERFGFGLDDDDDDDDSRIEDTSRFVLSQTGDDLSKETALFPKSLIKLLDVYMVNGIVLQDLNRSLELKRLREVERSLGVFKEVVRALASLRDGDRNSRLDRAVAAARGASDTKPTVPGYAALISAGMLDRIFYNAEALDPLPQLLRAWRRGKHTKRYAIELAELVHVSLKLLDSEKVQSNHEQSASTTMDKDDDSSDSKQLMDKGQDKKEEASSIQKALSEETKSRRNFDVGAYMLRLACPPAMEMYATLLESYAENDDAVNHYVYTFLYRLVRVPYSGHYSSGDAAQRPLVPSSAKISTMEPLVYHVRFLRAFAALVADKHRRKLPGVSPLVSLAADTLRHFNAHASNNPLLYVESLFAHAGPTSTRWVERLSSQYADLSAPLLADTKKNVREKDNDGDLSEDEQNVNDASGFAEESDEELDFEKAMQWDSKASKRAKKRKKEAAKARWNSVEDITLCLLLAQAYDEDQDRDSIDLQRLSRLSVLLPHHRETTALKRRLGHLEKKALEMEGATGYISDKLRAYAENLKAKKAPASSSGSNSTKRRRKSKIDDDLFPLGEDDDDVELEEDEVKDSDNDEEDAKSSDAEEPEQVQEERSDNDDDDEEDDRWKQPSFFKKRAAAEQAATQEKANQRRRIQRSGSDDESDIDDMPVSQDLSSRRRLIVQDEDDEDSD